MSLRQLGFYDPSERAREKQASRDDDDHAVACGEKSREQLWKENSFLPSDGVVDFMSIPYPR